MSRKEKIALLKGIAKGRVTPDQLMEFVTFTPIVIYMPGNDKYRLIEENSFMSKEKLKQRLKGVQRVFYIPDNNRERTNSI